MGQYRDAQHPPNATFPGERPTTDFSRGPESIRVTLDAWGPQDHLFTTLYDTSTATWGNAPTRSGEQPCTCQFPHEEEHTWQHRTGWCRLTSDQQKWILNAFSGGTLQQDLEGISLWFTIDGVTRAFTHEFVRTRLGAAFKQHGGRDNDWRHRGWTVTESIARTCDAYDDRLVEGVDGPKYPNVIHGRKHPIVDWKPIEDYIQEQANIRDHLGDEDPRSLRHELIEHIENGKRLYAALVDAGVAWQDARRVLTIGSQTYVHGIYNFVGFRGAAANRLEFIMDWEINCVFQLMLREIRMKCPPILSQYLGSHSDIHGRAMFDQLELCPPDGKYPSTTIRCGACGHAEANHRAVNIDPRAVVIPGERICEACQRDGSWSNATRPEGKRYVAPMHKFIPEDTLPRVFRREQQPFWVLAPESMAGGEIRWLWTNGHYNDARLADAESNNAIARG